MCVADFALLIKQVSQSPSHRLDPFDSPSTRIYAPMPPIAASPTGLIAMALEKPGRSGRRGRRSNRKHPIELPFGFATWADRPARSAPSYFFPRPLGARWESALPAAVFEALLVRPSRSTLEAALAALGEVFRLDLDIFHLLPFKFDAAQTHDPDCATRCQTRWCRCMNLA